MESEARADCPRFKQMGASSQRKLNILLSGQINGSVILDIKITLEANFIVLLIV